MKKTISYIVVIALVGVIVLSIFKTDNTRDEVKNRLDSSNLYPFYQSLGEEDKKIYVDICTAIEKSDSLDCGRFETYEKAEEMTKKVSNIFSSLIYEQPQYFWIEPSGLKRSIDELRRNELTIIFSRFPGFTAIDKEKEILDKKVSEIVLEASTKPNTFEQVLYVYDTILENTSYDYELYEKLAESNANWLTCYFSNDKSDDVHDIKQTAYGCLVEGKTVCSGYTLAFNLIMHELGYECGAVINSSFGNFGPSNHVSNYCKLDGDYYYFDLTWDDKGYEGYTDYMHRYFAITRAEFEKTHMIDKDAYAPKATATKYNYFVKNNMYFEKYDYETVKQSILSQSKNNFIVLKFSSYHETLKAESELINDKKIYSIIDKDECKYAIPKIGTFLYIFF